MTTSPADAATDASTYGVSNCEHALALLRQQGADEYKPVEFHYMEALARRMREQAPNVQRILEAKLARAVAAYQAEFEQAQNDAAVVKPEMTANPTELQTPLGRLVQSMVLHANPLEPNSWLAPSSARTELKSVRNFRNTWSTLSAQKQVSQALGRAPKNAGPINSHMLVLRSLELMRDISPDYLNRFMSYADTLLCLDQSDLLAKTPKAKPIASGISKGRTSARRASP